MSENITAIVRDPVCGMIVNQAQNPTSIMHEGRRYYFCREACRDRFLADPWHYAKPRGRFRRYLDRLACINESEFGGAHGGGCCHWAERRG